MGAIISELALCLIIAAALGFWIGWLLGCNHDKETHEEAGH
jgi:hypothetical protein